MASSIRTMNDTAAESFLAYLAREWASVPQVAANWLSLDEEEQLAFDLEWAIREDRLADVEAWSHAGILTAAQARRFEELQGVIVRNRPILETMLQYCESPRGL